MSGVHDGHRKRLRSRFEEHGLDGFNDVNVLELLLFYVLPRGDTNELAHRLLEEFGSLDNVFEASLGDLMKVKGVGRETAAFMRLRPEVCRRYLTRRCEGIVINNSIAAGRYIVPMFMFEKSEKCLVVCLDNVGKVIGCRKISSGTPGVSPVDVRQLLEYVISQQSVSVIIAHNHMSASAAPSREDEITTAKIKDLLSAISVKLVDHIVVAGREYVSMYDSGFLCV